MNTLHPREKECLYWTARGKSAEEISMILGIAFGTVRNYLTSIRTKLDCRTMAQAVYMGTKMGYLE
jgi:LuxR family transcriptional regulator, quorum-sensing system regulator CinR